MPLAAAFTSAEARGVRAVHVGADEAFKMAVGGRGARGTGIGAVALNSLGASGLALTGLTATGLKVFGLKRFCILGKETLPRGSVVVWRAGRTSDLGSMLRESGGRCFGCFGAGVQYALHGTDQITAEPDLPLIQ
jgi:hypothetical protein